MAEFIGSRNEFLDGPPADLDNTPTIVCPPIRLALPRHRWPALNSWFGREITLGFRPEDVRTVGPRGGSWEPLRAQVVPVNPTARIRSCNCVAASTS